MEPRPWHASYPKGVKHDIDLTAYRSVTEMIETNFKKYGDAPAYVNMDKTLTYAEVDRLSRDFAAYLQSLGMKKGDRIALQMPNLLQYPVAVFGALRAGLVIVNTNPLYTAREMAHQFKDSGAKAIVILANFADKLEKILPETQIEHVIVTRIGDMLGGLKGTIVNFVVKYIRKMEPAFSLPRAIPFKTALKKGAGQTFTPPEINQEDVGFLQYTGGTTGVSKGATLTQGNVLANMLMIAEWLGGELQTRQETVITALPLYHIFAFTVNCLTMVHYGARSVLITNPRDMPAFIKDLKKYPFTLITGVNTLFNGLLNQEAFKEVDFSSLKLAVGGGMAVQQAVNDKWKALTGVPILEGYGLSETSPVLAVNPIDGTDRIGTIGLPVPGTDLAIMDDEGKARPAGERGEICAKGPQVMQGYWQRPEENDRVFHPGGWFRTGDIGIMEPDGFFRIVDRKKDMILVSGFNVFPNEVEDVIAHHPGVLEVAVIGVPDPKSTEAVKAFIVKKDPALTKESVIAYCRENLTNYKVPKHVAFRDELPKSNVGKIIRRMLRDEPAK
ncbi:MAG: long-chain-fatty-acid--CoA ligase [Bacteroidetes bacterium]|nr:MAG: long-chain-fatty-acid--CoA ligase [Bacteroidota bacterium]